MKFGSLFAGIGGFDLGFERAGMECAWQVDLYRPDESPLALAEYEERQRAAIDSVAQKRERAKWSEINRYGRSLKQCSARNFPNAKRINDVRLANAQNLSPVDVICGGFPCQDLSVAGKRAGLKNGTRSSLFFEMVRITNELRPALLVWENVLGLFSSNNGRDFATVLMEMERIGYRGGWTTLDAQWFGLAQRRRRIFGVFARRDIGAAACAEILSLRARMSWDSGESKEAGRVSPPLTATGAGAGRTGNERTELDFCIPDVSRTITAREGLRLKVDQDNFVVANRNDNRSSNGHGFLFDGSTHTLGGSSDVIVLNNRQSPVAGTNVSLPLGAEDNGLGIARVENQGVGVRRLTPLECERLQGFPDGWTDGLSDDTRYRMLGNAVAVACAKWLGGRIVKHLASFPRRKD